MVGKQLKFNEYFKRFLKKNKYSNRFYGDLVEHKHSKIGYWIRNNTFTFEDIVDISYKDVRFFNLIMEFINDLKSEIEESKQTEFQDLQTLQEPKATYSTSHQQQNGKTKDDIIIQLQNQIIELNKLILTYQKLKK